MEAQLPQGLVKISDYKALLQSDLFLSMEKFSNNFLGQNREILSPYSRKWVTDPLHQWSRQWEYPFAFAQIENYAAAHPHRPIKILDAGSGITFLPYFISEMVPEAELMCCDTDGMLQEIFRAVNARTEVGVEFLRKDIKDTGLDDNSLDIIYCISVLEHTKNYDEIIKEFIRVLKSDGILIVTFDISLDGHSDIPLSELKKLVTSLRNNLQPTNQDSISQLLDEKNLFGPDIVTTMFILNWNKALLPWRYPLVSSLLASLKRRRFPCFRIKMLTFTCHTFEKI